MRNRILSAIPYLLVIGALILGVCLLVYGVGGMIEQNRLKAEYETVEGYYSDYSIYSQREYSYARRRSSGPTYRLIYTYTVGGTEYTVSTDYGTAIFPERGEARTVYYDPANPENAVLGGENSSQGIAFIGGMFTAVALAFILGWLYVTDRLPQLRIELMDVIMGAITTAFGGGFLYFMQGAFPVLMVIPLMLIAAGVWLIIRGLFFPGKQTKRK